MSQSNLGPQVFTSHGTVMFVAPVSGELRHGALIDSPANVVLFREGKQARICFVDSAGQHDVVFRPEYSAVMGSEKERTNGSPADTTSVFSAISITQREFGLQKDGKFLCAEADGRITLSRSDCKGWEQFQTISDDINAVRNELISSQRFSKTLLNQYCGFVKILNSIYLDLDSHKRAEFHTRFAKMFRSQDNHQDTWWRLRFRSKEIFLPLNPGDLWLDWDQAVSILGHDIEVKLSYDFLLGDPERGVELFIDVGANYGLHSLLFLACGVPTISFEPNKDLHEKFLYLCQINKVSSQIEGAAVGNSHDPVELVYPERDTWLGTVNTTISDTFKNMNVKRQTVPQVKLDDYLPKIGTKRTLIKIDAEGNELAVLMGGREMFKRNKPNVIFECWKDQSRTELFKFFASMKYQIAPLPWDRETTRRGMSESEFGDSRHTNFAAFSTKTSIQ